MTRPNFSRYVGIDYSGAETPSSSLKGLRVYEASRELLPVEIEPPPSPRKYWTRRGLSLWLVERLSEGEPALVGIDHGFSFPLQMGTGIFLCVKSQIEIWLRVLKEDFVGSIFPC